MSSAPVMQMSTKRKCALVAARAFYVEGLQLPLLFEDEILFVVGGPYGRVVLHRNAEATTNVGRSRPAIDWEVQRSASPSRMRTCANKRQGSEDSRSCGRHKSQTGGASSSWRPPTGGQ
jgi:hypothetical protein